MRRSKPDAFQAANLLNLLQQLNERGFAIPSGNVALSITGDDLAKQGDFFDTPADQLATLVDNILNRAVAFRTSCIRHDTEGAELITTLHNTHKGRRRFCGVPVEQVLPNRRFAFGFFGDFNYLFTFATDNIVEIISGMV